MVAKPPARKAEAQRGKIFSKSDHSHEWVVDVTTGRVARRECPGCAPDRIESTDSPRE